MSALVRRSLLFVPGSRPDRFAKAGAAGADLVCIDLEDAVAPPAKDQARADALAFLATRPAGRWALRINSLRSPQGLADLAAFVAASAPAEALMLPKVESGTDVAIVAAMLGDSGCGLLPLVESAAGLADVRSIAAAPRVQALLFGAIDLAADLGAELSWEGSLMARSACVLAASLAGVELLDSPDLAIDDPAGLTASTRRARALGFTGRLAIHPAQLAPIHAAFTPTAEEVAQARRIVTAYAAAGSGVVLLDGRMVERPVVRAMQRLLAIADHGA